MTTDERFTEGARLPRNDDGNALRVKHYLGDDLRYVKTQDQWYHWDGRRWHRATGADMIRVGRIIAHYIDLETPMISDADQRTQHRQHAGRSHHARAIKAMVDLARGDSNLWAEASEFNTDPYLWNFLNGTLDIRKLELREKHDPKDMLTGLIHHNFDTKAAAERYRKLVARTFQKAQGIDPTTLDFIQRMLGYAALVRRNFEQRIFFIIGPENCGKSRLVEIVEELLGPDHAHKAKTVLIARSRRHHDSETLSLKGRSFVTISETSAIFNLDETAVKELVGDRRTNTRKLFDPEEQTPLITWTILVVANEFPNVLEWDGAIKRRVNGIEAGPSVPDNEVITDLADTILAEEAEGVLAYLAKGAHDWYEAWQASQQDEAAETTGLALPRSARDFTETYAESQDHRATFITECVVLDANCPVASARGQQCRTLQRDVHDAFRRWRGRGETSDRNKLYAEIGKLPGVSARRPYFYGLCVRESDYYPKASPGGGGE